MNDPYGEIKTWDWRIYGSVEEWKEGFRYFCSKTRNKTYGLPCDRRRLMGGWRKLMHEESLIAKQKSS